LLKTVAQNCCSTILLSIHRTMPSPQRQSTFLLV
jgi:hypothetical protein